MTPQLPPTQLFNMQVQSHADATVRGISVWVDGMDATQARALACSRLAEAGWTVVQIDSVTETTADDYFRPCPSQQAFLRAQSEGVAWRFADE